MTFGRKNAPNQHGSHSFQNSVLRIFLWRRNQVVVQEELLNRYKPAGCLKGEDMVNLSVHVGSHSYHYYFRYFIWSDEAQNKGSVAT